ncbi:MAG: hypothetical protein KTR31_34825 [Myxococcales bacterium]|nr:hypothetical protein [Myxococcales bacterium]
MRHLALMMMATAAVACGGADGMDGADGLPGVDGEDGADGAAALQSARLAPGEVLQLQHGLGEVDKTYGATFEWQGVVYDHGDYPVLRPAHYEARVAFEDTFDYFYDGVAAATLTSGDHVVFVEGYVKKGDVTVYSGSIVSPDGGTTKVVLDDYVSDCCDAGYVQYYDLRVHALRSGGFVVAYDGWEDGVGGFVGADQYDADGTLVKGTSWSDESYDVSVVGLPDGGYAVVWNGYDNKLGDYELNLQVFDAKGVAGSVQRLFATSSSYVAMDVLSDGRLAVAVGVDDPEGDYTATDLVLVRTDGTVDRRVRLADSYITDDVSVVCGSQGTIFVAAEQGGPDLPYYAVLDEQGTFLDGPHVLSSWENDQISATAFADGDFWVGVTEDDSNALMTWVVGARGGLLRPMVPGDVRVVPDDDELAFVTLDEHTVGVVAGSYSSGVPAQLTAYSKGLLQLRVVSDDEVRLYNETAETLDVTLTVHAVR